jgi:hypothetical protein
MIRGPLLDLLASDDPERVTAAVHGSLGQREHTSLSRSTNHPVAVSALPCRCFGRKIWSMTSAPVVIAGRNSRR